MKEYRGIVGICGAGIVRHRLENKVGHTRAGLMLVTLGGRVGVCQVTSRDRPWARPLSLLFLVFLLIMNVFYMCVHVHMCMLPGLCVEGF